MISSYVIWFALFSMAGWLFESIYAAVTTGHWENRGFLFGPICPIYGTGAVGALVVFGLIPEAATAPLWQVFIVCMVGSAILEYAVSYVFERLFGAVWWDYSNLPLNLNGRICLPASLLFGVAGVAIVRYVLPVTQELQAHAEQAAPVATEAAALVIVAILAADTALTVAAITDLMEKLAHMDATVADRMERVVAGAQELGPAIVERLPTKDQLSAEAFREVAAGLTHSQRVLMAKIRRVSSVSLGGTLAKLRESLASLDPRGGRR